MQTLSAWLQQPIDYLQRNTGGACFTTLSSETFLFEK